MVISFTTDFGTADGYVGIMKGVALSIAPNCACVDISHDVSPGDIQAASWIIFNAYKYFAKGTVHVVVVDPGVGSQRRGIVVANDKYSFVCPDNGVLSLVLQEGGLWRAFEISNRNLWLPSVSNTFHGRDIFAPVAAFLAGGGRLDDVGTPLDFSELVRLKMPSVVTIASQIVGSVIYVDRFGNLISNIPASAIANASACLIASVQVPVGVTYSSVPEGHSVAYAGSHGFVEIGVNRGRADDRLGAGVGTELILNVSHR